MESSKWDNARPAIVSALAALAVYAVTLGGTFVYDDYSIFTADDRLRDVHQWWRYWTESYNGGVDNLYRPLVSMTYCVQWLLHGDAIAWPYHLVNWLLHAAVCAAFAEFVRRLVDYRPVASLAEKGAAQGFEVIRAGPAGTADPSPPPSPRVRGEGEAPARRCAYVAGLLFAIHPIHVEAVANIIGRAELMCALGFIGAMMLFLHRPLTIARSLGIFGCFILALLSKEQGMLLPPMLLVLGLCVRFRPSDQDEKQSLMLLVIVLCFSLSGYVVLREQILKFWWDRSFLDWTINPLVRSTGADRWLVPISTLGRYGTLLVFPYKLSPDYGANVIGSTIRWNEPWVYIGFAALATWLIACVFASVQRHRAAILALIGMALTYGLVSNIPTLIGTNFGERLMYLPSAFFILWIALTLSRLQRGTLVAITSIALIAGSVKTFDYARRWNDRLSFYRWAMNEQPQAIRLHMLLMSELKAQARLDEAAIEADRARQILPNYDEIWIHSADVAIERGRFDEAEQFLDHAMQLRPSMKVEAWKEKLRKRREAAMTTTPTTRSSS